MPAKLNRRAQAAPTTRRAAIYTRVSTQMQDTEDKISLSEQLADCERYCQEQGYAVAGRYSDVKSGATSKRPDFQRLIHDAAEGGFEVLVTWKVDRLGRGLFPMARLLEALEPQGIVIEAVKEKVDQRYLGLFASVGAIELQNIRERTMNMRRAYARKGQVKNGAVRYGYRLNANTEPEIHPEESAILLEAAARYAAGDMIATICRDFRLRGVPTRAPKAIRHGMAWPEPYLSKLLADEAYLTGRRTFGGESVQYPPIYTEDVWAGICARRARNAHHAKRNTKVDYLLQHVMWCRGCQLRFSAQSKRYYYGSPNAEGRRNRFEWATPRRYYRCVGMVEYGYKCRPGMMLTADDVEAAVWNRLAEALTDPETLLASVRARLDDLESEVGDGESHEAERELARLRLERLNLARERVRGKLDEPTLDMLLAEIDAQTAAWTERAEADTKLRADLDTRRRALDNAATYLDGLRRHVGHRLTELTYAERRELLLALVDRVWVDGEYNITIEGIIGGSGAEHQANCSTAFSRASM